MMMIQRKMVTTEIPETIDIRIITNVLKWPEQIEKKNVCMEISGFYGGNKYDINWSYCESCWKENYGIKSKRIYKAYLFVLNKK